MFCFFCVYVFKSRVRLLKVWELGLMAALGFSGVGVSRLSVFGPRAFGDVLGMRALSP